MNRGSIIISVIYVLLFLTGCGDNAQSNTEEKSAESSPNLTSDTTLSASSQTEDEGSQEQSKQILTNNNSGSAQSEETPLLAQAAAQTNTSKDDNERQQTLALIREKEDFRSKPYWDVNAWRVGYGQDTINGQRVTPGM